jgi:hypothetical protein
MVGPRMSKSETMRTMWRDACRARARRGREDP